MGTLYGVDQVDCAKDRKSNHTLPSTFSFGEAAGGFFTVHVEQIPEKKGVLFKHVEYDVTFEVSEKFSHL